MLRDATTNDHDHDTWAGGGKLDWKQIDGALRTLARQRGALEVDEAQLLCVAVRIEIWRELGRASLLEYLEAVLGYGPRAAKDRVRVALALDALPAVAEALATGELHWSAVRELIRVVTPATQELWLEHARGKNLRQIEQAVSGRKPGDTPSDPPDPDLTMKVVRLEVRPATFARLRQAEQVLRTERGMHLDDDALLAALCNAVLDGGRASSDDDEQAAGRAKFQVMTTVCERCHQGWQEGGGVQVAIAAEDVERAECDAQRIGSDRAPLARATQDIAPKTRRFVRRRDAGKCCVPGCRSARCLELHHVIPRSAGGGHDAKNIAQCCDAHHAAVHAGLLTITGEAPALEFTWTRPAHVGQPVPTEQPAAQPTHFALVTRMVEARQALVQAGFTKSEARDAVESAARSVGPDATLERLLFEALRRCPRPSG